MDKNIVFKMRDLDSYAIIDKPCTVLVKNNSRPTMDSIYTGDGYPRWILNLKAISSTSLAVLRTLADYRYTYNDIGHLLMTGSLWESQINHVYELPSKGEQMICVFDYVDEILTPFDEEPSSRGFEDGDGSPDRDVLYDQCVEFVLETRKVSTSSLQRKFSLGYNRAARIVDQMQEQGIVSEQGANGKREILV